MATILETLDFIIKAIVPETNTVTINSHDDNGVIYIEIDSPAEVTGLIIGKQGKTIKAIRTILNLCYPNLKYYLEIKN